MWQRKVPGAIPICALPSRSGQPLGHTELIERVRASSIGQLQEVTILLPLSEGRAIHAIETRATVLARDYEESAVRLKARIGSRQLQLLRASGVKMKVENS